MKNNISFIFLISSVIFSLYMAKRKKEKYYPLKMLFKGDAFGLLEPAFEGSHNDMDFKVLTRQAGKFSSDFEMILTCKAKFPAQCYIYSKNNFFQKIQAKLNINYPSVKTGFAQYDESFEIKIEKDKDLEKLKNGLEHIKNLTDLGFYKIDMDYGQIKLYARAQSDDDLLSPNLIMPALEYVSKLRK